jgi:RNA polymerase sigma factor (sigma-70 family)
VSRGMVLQELEDVDLISRCVSWDQGAWDALIARHGAFVQAEARRQLLRYLGRALPADVEDACQEVFSLLMRDRARTLRQFRNESSLSTWLSCVVRSICRQLARSERGVGLPSEEIIAPPPPAAPVDPEVLLAALSRLSAREQKLLRLFFGEGKKYRQIAQELRISINSVGPLLSRAIGAAKRILAP